MFSVMFLVVCCAVIVRAFQSSLSYRHHLKMDVVMSVQDDVNQVVEATRANGNGFIEERGLSRPMVCLNDPIIESGLRNRQDEGRSPLSVDDDMKKVNTAAAVLSSILAAGVFFIQVANPVSGVTLLHAMEADSLPITSAICNGKPTIVDFYADWCESCKAMAPTMRQMEASYGDKVNFIAVDGTKTKNAGLVDTFRVDGIPHVALLAPDTELKTSLIGALPKQVVERDIVALAKNVPLPYEGADPFEGDDHYILGDAQSKYCKPQ